MLKGTPPHLQIAQDKAGSRARDDSLRSFFAPKPPSVSPEQELHRLTIGFFDKFIKSPPAILDNYANELIVLARKEDNIDAPGRRDRAWIIKGILHDVVTNKEAVLFDDKRARDLVSYLAEATNNKPPGKYYVPQYAAQLGEAKKALDTLIQLKSNIKPPRTP